MYSGQNSSSIYTPTESSASSGSGNLYIGGNPNIAAVLGAGGGLAGWIGPVLIGAVVIGAVLLISKARKR